MRAGQPRLEPPDFYHALFRRFPKNCPDRCFARGKFFKRRLALYTFFYARSNIKCPVIIHLVEQLDKQIKRDGLASLCKGSYLPATLAGVRKQEIYACVNRYRGLI